MRNPDALEGRNTGRKLVLGGSFVLAAAGVVGVACGVSKVSELIDQQRATAKDTSLTWSQITAIQDARAGEVTETAIFYGASFGAAALGVVGAAEILISNRRKPSETKLE